METMHGMQSNTHNCLNLHEYKHLLENEQERKISKFLVIR